MDRNVASNPQVSIPDERAPLGTRPRRSNAPLYFFAVLLAAWIGVLVWMAANVGPNA